MNVLHVIAGIDPKNGGTTTALRNILHMESTVGITHEVLTLQWGVPDTTILATVPVYIARPSIPARYARSLDAMRWLIKNAERFDLCIIHGIWAWLPWKASKILAMLKKPFIFYPHGQLDPFDVQKKRIAKRMLGPLIVSRMLDRASAVLCTSKKEADVMVRYGSHPRMEVLPLPVPGAGRADGWRAKSSHGPIGASFKPRLRIADDAFIFLFLSRINYKKGLDILIPAFACIVADHPKAVLVIAGSDNEGYGREVRKLVVATGIESSVIFPGFLAGGEKEAAFREAGCFVLPSLNENFALAVVEALGAGLPVLISENVYIVDEIRDANAGWVCAYSVDSLAAALRRVIDEPLEYEEKKQAAKPAAMNFLPERLGPAYLDLYKNIIHYAGE